MDIKAILQFLHEVEKLKVELRHSWLSNGRQESVAEHTWRVALMALLIAPNLTTKPDLLKVLKMALIHDLNEAYIGDVSAFAKNHASHKDDEKKNMQSLMKKYQGSLMQEFCNLWEEYQNSETIEAKFVKALDKLEVRLQHNEANISTWEDIEFIRSQYAADKYCEFDEFIKELNEQIKKESAEKIINESDKNIGEIKQKAKKRKITN
jgi:putative hydrolases of HD superfamily